MGYGSYTASDWNKLRASRGLDASGSANQTFLQNEVLEKYDAKYIAMRESFDSEDSPESTPIIIGFDVTGSMGYLAQEIATNSLNETIMQILTKKPVTNPHMMCAAFTSDNRPLQVTQFEADIRVVEQLLDFCLGGGNPYSYDNILWYFAAKHTKIDSFEKRGKKGILIGIGDEICGREDNILDAVAVEKLFGDQIEKEISFDEALAMVKEKYEVVHIVVGPEYRYKKMDGRNSREAYSGWLEALPGRVAKLPEQNIDCLAEVIVAILQILNGEDMKEVISQVEDKNQEVVRFALSHFADVQAENVADCAKVAGNVESADTTEPGKTAETMTDSGKKAITKESLVAAMKSRKNIFDGLLNRRK